MLCLFLLRHDTMILLHHTIYLRSDAAYHPLFSIFSLSPQCEDFPYVISKLYSFYMMWIFFYLDSLFQLKICTMTLLISILIAFCMHLKENSKYSYSKNNLVMHPNFWNKLRDWGKNLRDIHGFKYEVDKGGINV